MANNNCSSGAKQASLVSHTTAGSNINNGYSGTITSTPMNGGGTTWYDAGAASIVTQIEMQRSNGHQCCTKCGTTIPKGFPFLESNNTNWCHLCFKDINDCLKLLLEQVPSEKQDEFIGQRFVDAL